MTTTHLIKWIGGGFALYVVFCLLFLVGCSGVASGLETAQAGLGAVDLATDELTDVYRRAVDLCKRNPEIPGCDRLGDPAAVLAKAEALGSAYDATAAGLDAMQAAHNDLAPHFEAAADIVRKAGMFSR